MSPSFPKELSALHCENFSKHPLFTTFSLFLTEKKVCNISNKYGLSNKSAARILLHKTPDTAPSFQQKLCALHGTSF